MKKKVLLGMSGGVDSSVAAALLLEKGYEVVGVTLKLKPDEYNEDIKKQGCCSITDVEDARAVAYKLGIDHMVFNFKDLFCKNVIDYFVNEYLLGRTPNPCIACNTYVKFGAMLERAKLLGFDYIATGHYARIVYDDKIKRWLLKKSHSEKDQSYVLYSMTQDQLSHTLLPICDIEKDEVRKIAEKYDLRVASKPDSQDICFIRNKNYKEFIKEYTGRNFKSGNFINKSGDILGKHTGIINYTVGQRKGLNISFKQPMYVTNINAKNNTVTLGSKEECNFKSAIIDNLNFIMVDSLDSETEVDAVLRYQSKMQKAKLIPLKNGQAKLEFLNNQRAVTPGQAAVFYKGDTVFGGGIIKS